jgi:hypothetical protein
VSAYVEENNMHWRERYARKPVLFLRSKFPRAPRGISCLLVIVGNLQLTDPGIEMVESVLHRHACEWTKPFTSEVNENELSIYRQ